MESISDNWIIVSLVALFIVMYFLGHRNRRGEFKKQAYKHEGHAHTAHAKTGKSGHSCFH
jgi:hypothetical protein